MVPPDNPSPDPSIDPRPRLEAAAELEAGLARVFPGIDIVDRDLSLGTERAVDLVGVDSTGRLVLVLLVAEDDDALALSALDSLAWARTHRGLLESHLGRAGLSSESGPLVVLIADAFEPRLIDRLRPLIPRSLRLLERCRLRSERTITTYLQPIGDDPTEQTGGLGVFLESLDEGLKGLVAELMDRLVRIDDEVECQPSPDHLQWIYRDSALCSVFAGDGVLEGQFPDREETLRLSELNDLESFVDAVQELYLHVVEAGGVDDPSLPIVELRPTGPRPHLSAEELEAFR